MNEFQKDIQNIFKYGLPIFGGLLLIGLMIYGMGEIAEGLSSLGPASAVVVFLIVLVMVK